jgi:hypothetical protein
MRHELLRPDQAQPVSSPILRPSRLVGLSHPATRYPVTHELPVGAQARLMKSAAFSQALGRPIDTLLTINAAHLQLIGEGGVFGIGSLWDGFRELHELMRKWVTGRDVFWACIWVREWARRGHRGQAGEHWHLGMHMPASLRAEFAPQVAVWTGEGIGAKAPSSREAAVSVTGAWHLSVRAGRGGPDSLAAYLGKAEPGYVTRYGKRVPNVRKPRRDKHGGNGPIQGKRFGISRSIGTLAQADAALR